MYLKQIAHILGVNPPLVNPNVKSICTDTRQINSDDLFLAIKGKHFNGHHFIHDAEVKGASAIIASERVQTKLPTLLVPDTVQALGSLAKSHRTNFNPVIIALTGSTGKTSTKEMISSILKHKGNVLYSHKNFNNHIGVPLTLLMLEKSHNFVVLEMGANHPGEISYLTNLAKPNIALITNIGEAHLEGFGNLEGVMHAKAEIFQGVLNTGIAVVNGDNKETLSYFESKTKNLKFYTFGLNEKCSVHAKAIHLSSKSSNFIAITPLGSIQINLPLPGQHNVLNSLASIAATLTLVPLPQIKIGLEQINPIIGRLNSLPGVNNSSIIDDTYNANPYSTEAALKFLAMQSGVKIFVFGGMVELGNESEQLHGRIGTLAKQLNVDMLFTIGKMAEITSKVFGDHAEHFSDQTSLINALKTHLKKDTLVLVKGSRLFQMENIVNAITLQNAATN